MLKYLKWRDDKCTLQWNSFQLRLEGLAEIWRSTWVFSHLSYQISVVFFVNSPCIVVLVTNVYTFNAPTCSIWNLKRLFSPTEKHLAINMAFCLAVFITTKLLRISNRLILCTVLARIHASATSGSQSSLFSDLLHSSLSKQKQQIFSDQRLFGLDHNYLVVSLMLFIFFKQRSDTFPTLTNQNRVSIPTILCRCNALCKCATRFVCVYSLRRSRLVQPWRIRRILRSHVS